VVHVSKNVLVAEFLQQLKFVLEGENFHVRQLCARASPCE
jgi:hypothetical protein